MYFPRKKPRESSDDKRKGMQRKTLATSVFIHPLRRLALDFLMMLRRLPAECRGYPGALFVEIAARP
jgi:hypothetical protein